jgi:hypothetical protein
MEGIIKEIKTYDWIEVSMLLGMGTFFTFIIHLILST